jgi:hypothetical protein
LRIDFFASLRLCEQKEERDKRQEVRDKKQETRSKSRSRIDFFAASRLCEQKEENSQEQRNKKQETCLPTGRQETRTKRLEPFAVRFLCGSAPLRDKRSLP